MEHTGSSKDIHYIVGIGASAGGLEAIHEFFDNIPEPSDLSFVIVQHLSPDYKSLMAELLTKHTRMKVFEANDNMEVLKNCVYVIPNKKNLIIDKGRLRLIEKVNIQSPNTAIDIFLDSLAGDKERMAIAVILSGTGSDGTRGIASIHSKGGLVIAQDPLTAKFDGMPNSAISSGNVDFILPPELMYEEITNYIKQGSHKENLSLIDTPENEQLVVEILELIKRHTSYDFTYYKRPTINRRILRRMVLNNFKSMSDYLDNLYANTEEVQLLSKEFLIGVTKFFRDTEAWDIINKKVVKDIVNKKNYNEPLKVWVAGCSTGEEAYSIAISIKEELIVANKDLNVKIFATDLDKEAIETATKGLYPETIQSEIPADLLEKYFIKEGNKYQIDPHIRKMVIFANHDLLKDPPFSRIDFISCRNLLIYLNPVLQKKVISTFHFAMNLGAYLFLGSSESIGESTNFLVDVDKKWKIYKNIQATKGIGFDSLPLGYSMKNITSPNTKIIRNQIHNNFAEILNETIIDEFGYAGIYVDENYELIHAIGDFKKFIELPDRKFNLNILKMISEELTVPLGSALRKAFKSNEKSTIKNIRIKTGKASSKLISLVVKPFLEESNSPRFSLILFNERNEDTNITLSEDYFNSDESNNQRIKDLEYELKETKENLQSAIEELETSNEELQSANEELLSANEELQSTNEELQSLNEELHTVNSEHQLKIKELMELNDDLNNYFRTSEIGQIFLDRNLNIRKFTPAATKQINLIETDIGRPISHISYNIKYDKMVEDVRQVISTKESLEKEIQLSDNEWYIMRIVPYIRQDKRTDGVVVTFLNVSKLKELNEVISGVLNSSLSGIMALRAVRNSNNKIIDFEWIIANKASGALFNKPLNNFIGKRFSDEFSFLKTSGLFEKYIEVIESGNLLHTQKYFDNDIQGHFDIVAVKMGDGLVVTFTDISAHKKAEENVKLAYAELQEAQQKLKVLNAELEKRVEERTKELKVSETYLKSTNENLVRINNDLDNFIYTASHDLRAPISNIEGLVDAIDSVIESENAEAKEMIELMRFSVEKFKDTIKDLTEISRIQKEKLEDIEEVDVNDLLTEVETGIKEMISESKVQIKTDIQELKIRFSRKNLRSIFYNLLSNAIKYRSPERKPEVKIRTERRKDGYVMFSITDNGLGIPAKHQHKVFSMFKRFHDHVDGTGVGLYIVKRILDNEGGMISVESEEGKGTTFNVLFKQ